MPPSGRVSRWSGSTAGMVAVATNAKKTSSSEYAYDRAFYSSDAALEAGVNWLRTSWFATLTKAGRRAIALDNRGHGASTKLYDPADYHSAIMAEDVRAMLDHLEIERADLMGYSMGSRIAGDRSRLTGNSTRFHIEIETGKT